MISSFTAVAFLLMAGCGGGGGGNDPEPSTPQASGIPQERFKVIVCDEKSAHKDECRDAQAFDLKKEIVAILEPSEKIGGVSEYAMFGGKRFGLVPKEEKSLSPLNFVAYGIFKYAQEVGSDWCGPCRMVAPQSYSDAKKQLKELFNLTGTKEQNEALLWLIDRNLEAMGESGVDLKEAYFADIKALAESLVNLTKHGNAPDLSGLHLVKDSKGRVLGVSSTPANECPDYLGGCIESWGVLDKNRALKLGNDIHRKSGNLTDSQKAFESLTCEANEVKQIYMFGVEDNFDPSNLEPVNPQGGLLTMSSGWPHQSSYDNNTMLPSTDANGNVIGGNFLLFAETLSGLPTNMTKGRMAIGVKRLEQIGSSGLIIEPLSPAITQLNPNLTLNGWGQVANTNTYYQNLNQIMLQTNTNQTHNLLQHLQSGNGALDIVAYGYIDIDYIAIAACVPNEPTGTPITEVPVNLECNADKGEQLVEVWGGVGDDFAIPIDTTNPPAGFSGAVKYDEEIDKLGTFADRITLPNQTITKMVVTVNTRAGANGYQNDQILLGDVASSSGVVHDPNDTGVAATLNGGIAHQVYGSTALTVGSGTLLDLVNNTHYLDVIAHDQTEVDSVRVSLCVADKKDGDISIHKRAGRIFKKGDTDYAYFHIEFNGTLPHGETLVINEEVASGATLEILSLPQGWICNPSATPISGAVTLTCHISATNGDMNPIPAITLVMSSQEGNITNCAKINKESQGVSYNSNPDNDHSCDSAVFPTPPPTDDPKACSQRHIIYLDNSNVWRDVDTGNAPNVNNPIPNTWDNSYTWFEFDQNPWYGYFTLETQTFCACGSKGGVKIEGMRIDNVGNITLKNITDGTNTIVTAQNTATTHNFMAQYPAASGSTVIPAHVVGKEYKLQFNIHNHKLWVGGAVKGKLEFTGHWGECTKNDYVPGSAPLPDDNSSQPSGPIVIFTEANLTTFPPDVNETIVVVEEEIAITAPALPIGIDTPQPTPIVITGGDLYPVATTPESQFPGAIPSNYTLLVGCANGYISLIYNGTTPLVYETPHKCDGEWLYSNPQ